MPDFLKLAEIMGQQIKASLEPLQIKLDAQQKELDALRAENAELRTKIPAPVDIAAIAKEAAELVPVPQDGKDGADGQDGKDGRDGKDGANGLDGKDGQDGKDGADGKDAAPVSEVAIADTVAAQFERRFSDLVLSWERQARDEFAKAVDRLPAPKDGKDGLPADAVDIQQDGRTVTITVGEKSHTIKLDTVIDRGVWKDGEFEKGDGVSYGGNFWIAQDDTSDCPGTSKAWRLAVRKGRDGRDLRDTASTHDSSKGLKV